MAENQFAGYAARIGLVSMLLAACGGANNQPQSSPAMETPMLCTPGDVQDCGCVYGQATCSDDGSEWECNCAYPTAQDLTTVWDDSQVYVDASRAYISRGSSLDIESWTGAPKSGVSNLPATTADIQALTGNDQSLFFSYAAYGDATFRAAKDTLKAAALSLGDVVPDGGPEAMGASADTLFLAYLDADGTADTIYSCPAAKDCTAIAEKQPQPSELSWYGDSLFWNIYLSGDQFSVIALDLADSTSKPITLTNNGSLVQIADDGVYFANCTDSGKCELDRTTSATASAEVVLDHVPSLFKRVGDQSYFLKGADIVRQGPDDASPKVFYRGDTVHQLLTNGIDLFAVKDVPGRIFPDLFWLGDAR